MSNLLREDRLDSGAYMPLPLIWLFLATLMLLPAGCGEPEPTGQPLREHPLASYKPPAGFRLVNLAVSKVSGGSAVLVVKTSSASNVTVAYGPASGVYEAGLRSSSGLIRHEVPLDGFTPGSTVYYKLTVSDAASPAAVLEVPEKSFRAAKAPGQPITFGVMGDTQPMKREIVPPWPVWETLTAQMAADDLDLAFIAGDIIAVATPFYEQLGWTGGIQDDPTLLHFDSLESIVAKYDAFFAGAMQLTPTTPLYAIVGNHEEIGGRLRDPADPAKFQEDPAGYKFGKLAFEQEFTLPENDGAEAASYPEEYYSFRSGDTHFIVLSTEQPGEEGMITGVQKAWLEKELAGSEAAWKVVFMHRPLFSMPVGGEPWQKTDPDSEGYRNKVELHELFKKYGVRVVFQAHGHYYARHEEDGLQYVITGGGGANAGRPPACQDDPARRPEEIFAEDIYACTFHYVKVEETPATMSVSAIRCKGDPAQTATADVQCDGAVLDSFTVEK